MTSGGSNLSSSAEGDSSKSQNRRRFWIIKILSVLLIVLFPLSVLAQVGAILLDGKYSHVAAGIWCGVLYAVTGIAGLVISIRHIKTTVLISCSAAVTSLSSLALVTLAALSLGSVYPESEDSVKNSLWIACNSLLVALGSIGFIACMTLIAIAAKSTTPDVPRDGDPEPKGTVKEEVEVVELTQYMAPSDVLTVTTPVGLESDSQTSSGIYEAVESNQGNPPDDTLDPEIAYNDPIYAIPIKKEKYFVTLPADDLVGDFEIQLDTRRDSELLKESKHKTTFRGSLFATKAALDVINSDDEDSHGSRYIELSPEDIVVHSPSDGPSSSSDLVLSSPNSPTLPHG